jgi:thiol-disulfide isomerase/thioredoxin
MQNYRSSFLPLRLIGGLAAAGALTAAAFAWRPAPVPSGPAPLAADLMVRPVGKGGLDRLARYTGAKATVLLFVGTECPISNGYAPKIAALSKRYQQSGANVVLVYSNAGTTPAAVEKHRKAYGLTRFPALLDGDQKLADSVGATCTPEAFVLDAGRAVRYHGRIDDRFVARGTAKGTGAKTHELSDALDAVLTGKPVKVAAVKAVGCAIERAKVAVTGPTYAHDIAPILNASCVSCHRDGEIGPMALDTYGDARRWATNIATVTGEKRMPPWKPTADCGPFVGERKLTAAQVTTLKQWADAGAPLGDPKDLPPAPKFAKGWRLGEPDLVLTMPAAWKTPATGADIYRCFVLPTNLTEDKEVVAVEYRAGNKSVVHHVLGYVDTASKGRKKDAAEDGDGYTSFGGPGFTPQGEMGGWAPGNLPQFLPEGIGRPLPAGSDLILQVHYHPTGKPEEDRTSVGLYFAKKPITKKLRTIPIVAPLNIPPGEANYQTVGGMPVPFDARVISVTPHMHLLGRKIALSVTLPDGSTKPLIRIDDWDFNWQDTYTFKEAVRLPRGAKVALQASYDNSSANPRNPNSPPQPVRWGEKTTDEMCIGFISFIVEDENDPIVRLMDSGLMRRGGGAAR